MTRRIAMFAGAAAAVLLVAWFFLLWSPKGSELDKARQRRASAQQQADQLQVQLDRLKDAERRAPELQAAKDRLVSAVPDKPELAAFILDVNDAASKAGVDFLTISPTPPAVSTTPGVPSEIRFKLNVGGRYDATLDFLQRLTELPRIVVFDGVQVHPQGGQGTTSSDLAADLTGRLFTTAAPPTPPGATTTTIPVRGGASTTTTTVKAAAQ